jgi:hypothetical protein
MYCFIELGVLMPVVYTLPTLLVSVTACATPGAETLH